MPITCKSCGEKNADDALVCGMCGLVLPKSGNTAPPPQPTVNRPAMNTANRPMPQANRAGTRPTMAPPPPVMARQRAASTPQYTEYAGFWPRVLASIIDSIIINIIAGVLAALAYPIAIKNGPIETSSSEPSPIAIIMILVAYIGPLIYMAGMESSSSQATLGKMALGLQVTDTEGYPISFGRAFGRNLAKIISALACYVGFIMPAFTAKKQGLHDLIASTLVVKK